MILQDILNRCTWNAHGIQCPGDMYPRTVHKFLREAVLDRHIYLTKAIGFTFHTQSNQRTITGNYISRNKNIGESYPEVMKNLQDKVFINVSTDDCIVLLEPGMNTMHNIEFTDNNVVLDCLYTNPDVCRCLNKNVMFKLKLLYDCGFRNMSQNSDNLSPEYYPCMTDYSLSPYVRILPMVELSNLIQIRYYNGMTPELFKDILSKWSIYIQTGSLKEGEIEWLRNFVH